MTNKIIVPYDTKLIFFNILIEYLKLLIDMNKQNEHN